MEITREILKQNIDELTTEQLQEVSDFIAFLKYRKFRHSGLDVNQLMSLQTEFAQEDRQLAEAGMDDYAVMLNQEDHL